MSEPLFNAASTTTTMNKPQVMQINMPLKPKADDPEPPKIAESRVMTMILGKDDMVWYYEGLENPEIKNASMAEMRPILINKREKVKNDPAFGPELPIVVIIKPTEFGRKKPILYQSTFRRSTSSACCSSHV